ncbi:hypothetical protein Nepgr_021441 [Nepenthes gracilis]|uniref:Uncharacterized protein n=1 Tax=Nepenthes gracilis TaxID=150966 RepID=A0AAD3SYM6_NEPGR|nr:hypothetical protein Nepgr_021441 [Nepenthes gracilis]
MVTAAPVNGVYSGFRWGSGAQALTSYYLLPTMKEFALHSSVLALRRSFSYFLMEMSYFGFISSDDAPAACLIKDP